MDACKQGGEKTIYASALLSARHQHTNTTPPPFSPPVLHVKQLMENNSVAAVAGRYFNKNQHVSLLIITQTTHIITK